LTDDVIFQRYVEMEGRMRKVMSVIKMRGSAHSKDLRLYDVTPTGLEIGSTLYDYRGVITGVAQRHLADESEDVLERAEKTRQVEQLVEAYEQGRAQPGDPEIALA